MKTKEIFDLAIRLGVEADFRGSEGVAKVLERRRKKYEKMSAEDKLSFDVEVLDNPYSDSRIHNISEDKEIKKVLAGIDMDTGELLMAKQLEGIDLVISHHPIGKALSTLADVMEMQVDILSHYGVPVNIAEGLTYVRSSEVARGVNAANHNKTVDAARILGINLINCHTATDNLVAKFLKDIIEEQAPDRLEDLLGILKSIPEYQQSSLIGVGPKIFAGRSENRCGKIALTEITGGTSGSPKLFEKMADAGIGTLIGMHISEEHRKEAEAANLNVVIAGHISSDSLGMNLFLDELEKKGIEVIPCSGLIRIKRLQ